MGPGPSADVISHSGPLRYPPTAAWASLPCGGLALPSGWWMVEKWAQRTWALGRHVAIRVGAGQNSVPSDPEPAPCSGPSLATDSPTPPMTCPHTASSPGSSRRCLPLGGKSAAAAAGRTSASGSSAPPCSCASSAQPLCPPRSSTCFRSTPTTAPLAHSPSSPKSPRTWPTLPSECHVPPNPTTAGWSPSLPSWPRLPPSLSPLHRRLPSCGAFP